MINRIKYFFYKKRIHKEYIAEIEDDFLINKYKIIKIMDLIGEYKRGGNPFSILRQISDIL